MKRFYPDTNVIRHALEGRSALDARRLLLARNRIRLPHITALELIEDLYTCRPEKFPSRRGEVDLAYKLGREGRLLPAPGEFLARQVFKARFSDPIAAPQYVLRWMRIASTYRSKNELGKGVKVGGIGSCKWGLDVKVIAEVLKKARTAHVRMVDWYRDTLLRHVFAIAGSATRETQFHEAGRKRLSRYFRSGDWKCTFVKGAAKNVAASVSDPQATALYHLLEPAAEFLATLLSQSLTQGYKYWEAGNDAADYKLLLYLCDSNLVFVTDDNRLKEKLRSKAVRDRVIDSEALARELCV